MPIIVYYVHTLKKKLKKKLELFTTKRGKFCKGNINDKMFSRFAAFAGHHFGLMINRTCQKQKKQKAYLFLRMYGVVIPQIGG